QECGAVSRNAKEAIGKTKQRRCSAQTRAVSMTPVTGSCSAATASICDSPSGSVRIRLRMWGLFVAYDAVCQEWKIVVEQPRRRSEAKQETREALIAAALAEFAEHGLDAPSLDAICARAGYTRGAFYVHFRDRADLLVAVVEHAMTVFMDAVIATGGEGHDLERTIDRFAGAVAGAIGGGAASTQLPLPAGVSFARVLEGV